MIDRVTGPMHFRVLLQPLMASIFAILDGLQDAKAGKPVYFWSIFTRPEHRGEIIKDGWNRVGRIFIFAMIIDIVYQFIVERWVYPLEVLITAFLLAIVPYLILRGLVNRLASIAKK
jgi:hypothetical protein